MGGGATYPPASYDVISGNHSNWPSLNLSQNVRKGWTNSYWKRQVLMFYPLEKNSKKPYGGGGIHLPSPPPPCTSEGYLGAQLGQWKSIAQFPSIFFFNGDGPLTPWRNPWRARRGNLSAYFHPKAAQHGWTHQEPNYKVPTSIIKAHKSPNHVSLFCVALIDILTLPFNGRY